MSDIELHRPLINQQGSRAALNTPALVLDRDALERNIAAMAAFARSHNIVLRPHAKTHKSVHVARLQMAAGARGVCCAKLGEAEALAGQGIKAILITSPVVTPQAIARLMALHERIGELMVVADHPSNVDALAAATRDASRPLPIIVDIDPGIRRTGVASPEAALDLAQRISAAPSLRFAGVQFYCGAQQHIESFADRRAAIEDRTAYLRSVIDLLAANGLVPEIITGGGNGPHRIDAGLGVINELQVGSYVFMDKQYLDCDLSGEAIPPFETALYIDAHVISANAPSMATIDAGFKPAASNAAITLER